MPSVISICIVDETSISIWMTGVVSVLKTEATHYRRSRVLDVLSLEFGYPQIQM